MADKECLKKIELIDILNELPDIQKLDWDGKILNKNYDIFICSLGFEERCLSITEQLTKQKILHCRQAIVFEYSTNIEDNDNNKPKLFSNFQHFSENLISIKCDEDDFTKNFRNVLEQLIKLKESPDVLFDISVCSSKLLISVLKILFEYNLSLHVVYSEAEIYHPTCEEFKNEPEKWTTEEGLGIARGVDRIIPSAEFPGSTRENADFIVVFPTFKPERTKAIMTYIDEAIARQPEKKTVWIIGKPHMDEKTSRKRMDIIRKINKINGKYQSYEICTLNYKKTLEILENIYKKNQLTSHIDISSLGSKMQSLGIFLFCYIRPNVSIYHALPKEYNPNQYSEGCKENWIINFGNVKALKNILNTIGTIKINNLKKLKY